MRKVFFLMLLAGGTAAAGATEVSGRDLVERGNERGAVACAGCHGVDGAGLDAAGFPRLSGLSSGYLVKQLADFASGRRSSPIMAPIAKALDSAEIKAASDYYAALPAPPTKVTGRAERPVAGDGEQLALRGDWPRGIPECVSCHGPGGVGVGDPFPRLAGQHASYLANQLRAWQVGDRRNDPADLMSGIAKRLDETQIKAVAEYFAHLNQH